MGIFKSLHQVSLQHWNCPSFFYYYFLQPREIFLTMQQIILYLIHIFKWRFVCFSSMPLKLIVLSLILLAVDNMSFYKTLLRYMYVKTLLFVADLLFKRPICDKVPLWLFIALPGIQRKSTKRLRYCWEPQISERKTYS